MPEKRDCVRECRLHSGAKLGKLASGDGCSGKSTEVLEPVRKQGTSPGKEEEDVERGECECATVRATEHPIPGPIGHFLSDANLCWPHHLSEHTYLILELRIIIPASNKDSEDDMKHHVCSAQPAGGHYYF